MISMIRDLFDRPRGRRRRAIPTLNDRIIIILLALVPLGACVAPRPGAGGAFSYDTNAWRQERMANGDPAFVCDPGVCGEPVRVETYVEDLSQAAALQSSQQGLEFVQAYLPQFSRQFVADYTRNGFRVDRVIGPRQTRFRQSPAFYWRFELTHTDTGKHFKDTTAVVVLPGKMLGVTAHASRFSVSDKYMRQFINGYHGILMPAGDT